MAKIGRYEIEAFVARGGMGEVYRARLDAPFSLSKTVAIKRVARDGTDAELAGRELADEARIGLGIDHPNVARVFELVDDADGIYLVMEWLDGRSLSQLQSSLGERGRRVPLGVALHIVRDVCAGLHAAHELTDTDGRSLEVVHRDVSPQNIVITRAGQVKLIDFGIAKSRDRFGPATLDGGLKGKLRYVSPVQILNRPVDRPVDRRADVWGVGAVLFEMVAGVAPFAHASELEILNAHVAGATPTLGVAVDTAVQRLLTRSLAPATDGRFPTAAAMGRAIQDCIEELELRVEPATVAQCFHRGLSATQPRALDVPEHVSTRRGVPSLPLRLTPASRSPLRLTPRMASPFTFRRVASLGVATAVSLAAAVFAVRTPAEIRVGPRELVDVHAAPSATGELDDADHAGAAPITDLAARSGGRVSKADGARDVPVAPQPATRRSTAPARAPRGVRARPDRVVAEKPACDPPYTIDDNGHRIYRAACL